MNAATQSTLEYVSDPELFDEFRDAVLNFEMTVWRNATPLEVGSILINELVDYDYAGENADCVVLGTEFIQVMTDRDPRT